MTAIYYANKADYAPEYVPNSPSKHWKHWDYISNLTSNKVAYCVKEGSRSTIATRNGTYYLPAPLLLNDFKFDFPNGTIIEKVIVHYSHQKFSDSASKAAVTYPKFAGPKITLMGTGQTKTGNAVPSTYTGNVLEFTGITAEQLNSKDFGIHIAYPLNNSTNTGRMCLGNVYIEVVTKTPSLILSASASSNNCIIEETVDVTFNVERVTATDYKPEVTIDVPDGLTFEKTVSGHGTATLKDKLITWNSEFSNGRNKNTIVLRFKCTAVTTASIIMQDVLSNSTNEIKINISDFDVTLSTDLTANLNKPITVNTKQKYNIVAKTTSPTVKKHKIKIQFSSEITLHNIALLRQKYPDLKLTEAISPNSFTTATLEFTINLNKTETIPMQVSFLNKGLHSQIVTIDDKKQLTSEFLIQGSDYLQLGFSRLLIPSEYTEAMGDKVEYRFMSVIKHIIKNSSINLTNWKNNLRIGVFNANKTYLDSEDDFLTHVKWSSSISTKKWTEYIVDFVYDAKSPLYLVFSHDYLGNPLYENIQFDFTQPVIVEKQYWGTVDLYKKYIVPLSALCKSNVYGDVTLTKFEDTAPAICYDWSNTSLFKTEDVVLRGIVFNCSYVTSEQIELQITISAEGIKKKGYRNITLRKGSGTVTLGGNYDLFGLKPHDLRGHAADLTVEITINNPYDRTVTTELSHVVLRTNYLIPDQGPYSFTIDGERSEEYGIYFYDMTYNLGTKNETKEYNVSGTDNTIVSRMNIKPKEISVEFAIDECKLEDAIELADDVILKLFTNSRNVLTNKPTEKTIIFDHMPNKRYLFIRKDEIDDKVENGVYYAKVDLYIPKGTAEVIPQVVTGSSGATGGLISIEPIITLLNNTKGKLLLNERETEQHILIESEKIGIGDVITINNENRTATLVKKGTTTSQDITKEVDFSTTWFKVRGEYLFESDTSTVVDIRYYERR